MKKPKFKCVIKKVNCKRRIRKEYGEHQKENRAVALLKTDAFINMPFLNLIL